MGKIMKKHQNIDIPINIVLKQDTIVVKDTKEDPLSRERIIAHNISLMSKNNWGKYLQKK